MKTLLLIGHPNLKNSRTSKLFLEENLNREIDALDAIYIQDLFDGGNFNPKEQQKILKQYDKYIILVPIFWYNVPAIVKKYIDETFTYGWAHGENGDKVKGKKLQFIWTAGKTKEDYSSKGVAEHNVEEFFVWAKKFAEYCNMEYVKGHTIFNIYSKSDDEIRKEANVIIDKLV